MATPLSAWVFIDGQNVYNDARRAFHDPDNDPGWCGQYDPWKYGELLVELGNKNDQAHPRVMEHVRLYQGMPVSSYQPSAHASFRRKRAAWEALGVEVFARPLRYPKEWPKAKPEEKGIDVQLAVDLLYNGYRHNYEIAIVASTDTDLVPALEAVCDLRRAWGKPRLEVVSWVNPNDRKRLSVAGHNVWCHWLTESHYVSVQDKTDYNIKPTTGS